MIRSNAADGALPTSLVAANTEVVLQANGTDALVVPDPAVLFRADFQRHGPDLLLVNDSGADVRILDYFTYEPAPITSADGGRLSGAAVESLAGPVAPGQYAQADPSNTDGLPIGQVELVEGTALVQRVDGTEEVLELGSYIYQGDIVSTAEDGSLSVTFIDETQFTLSADARIVIDELVYAPENDDNSAAFNLLEGGFVFVAGQVAKTGDMELETPTATLGIRGTTFIVDILDALGIEVRLRPDFGSPEVGIIELFDPSGNLIATITSTETSWVVPFLGTPSERPRTAADEAADQQIVSTAETAFNSVVTRMAAGELPVNLIDTRSDGPGVQGGPGTSEDPPAPDGLNPNPVPDPTQNNTTDDNAGSGGTNSGEVTVPETPTVQFSGPPAPITLEDVNEAGTEDVTFEGFLATPISNPVYSVTSAPQNGTLVLFGDGSYEFTPAKDFSGPVTFGYQAANADGAVASGVVTLDLAAVNDAPTLEDGTMAALEDGPAVELDLSTLGDDVDSDDDATTLTYSIETGPSEGSASIIPAAEGEPPKLRFDPGTEFQALAKDESKTVTIKIKATDSNGAVSEIKDVDVTVTGVNDAPVIDGATDLQDSTLLTFPTIQIITEGAGATAGATVSDTHTLVSADSLDTEIEAFFDFSPGILDLISGGDATDGSAIQFAPITLLSSSTVSFTWSFTGGDGIPANNFWNFYKDFAFVSINDQAQLLYQFDEDENAPEITNQTAEFTIGPGTYEFGFGSMNLEDRNLDATLVVSDFSIRTNAIKESVGDSSAQDIAPTSGTITISDKDIGDTLTVSVTGDATASYSGGAGGALPSGVNIQTLIAAGAISLDPLVSNGGSQTINWTYDPAAADLDWLAEGEMLTITFEAQVSDGTTTSATKDLVVQIAGASEVGGGSDPIVLDLDGDGVELSAPADGVAFDIDADGDADQIGWVGPDDGLLVIDGDGNGIIDDGSEVFSEVFEGGAYASSLDALRSLDSNGDGVIDAKDTRFGEIKVWQDADSDGQTDGGELKTLSEHGIISLDLDANDADTSNNGNLVFAEGEFTTSDGDTGSYVGVSFGTKGKSEFDGDILPVLNADGTETVTEPSGTLPKLGDVLGTVDPNDPSIDELVEQYADDDGSTNQLGSSTSGDAPGSTFLGDEGGGFLVPSDDDVLTLDTSPIA